MATIDGGIGTECNSGTRVLRNAVTLRINGIEIEMVPFVQNILRNAVVAVAQELEGFKEGAWIEVEIQARE
jgi:molybdopterin-guanine dinucleotide biosynthesis protein B